MGAELDQNGPIDGGPLPGRKELAAALVAEDRFSDRAIAARVGIAKSTLALWKLDDDFRERVEAIRSEVRAEIRARGVADLESRIAALDDRWRELNAIIVERAQAPEMQTVPGGKTGLLARSEKPNGRGGIIEVFEVDAGLLRELREIEKQAAKELGQWVDRAEVVQDEDDPIDELRKRLSRRVEQIGEGPGQGLGVVG